MDATLLQEWLAAQDNHLAYLAFIAAEEQRNADCTPETLPF